MSSLNPTSSPRLLEPGLRSYLPYGMERYQVPAMGTIVVTLTPEDSLTIRDPEGRQCGELVVFGEDGREDAESLGTKASKEASGLKSILSQKSVSANKVTAALKRGGLNIGKMKAVPLFSKDSLPDEEVTFRASRELTCVIASLGENMIVEEQNPPTDLVAFVQRANPENAPTPDLPEPSLIHAWKSAFITVPPMLMKSKQESIFKFWMSLDVSVPIFKHSRPVNWTKGLSVVLR